MASTEFGTLGANVSIDGTGTRHSVYTDELTGLDANIMHRFRPGANQILNDLVGSANMTAQNGAVLSADGLECVNATNKYAKTGAAVNLVGVTGLTVECWSRFTGPQDIGATGQRRRARVDIAGQRVDSTGTVGVSGS